MPARTQRSLLVRLLPGADRADVGAGYVMVAVALLSGVAYAALGGLAFLAGLTEWDFLLILLGAGGIVGVAGLPVAFVGGVLAWRRFPPDATARRPGARLGGATALCCLLCTSVLTGASLSTLILTLGSWTDGIGETAFLVGYATGAVVLLTLLLGSWIVAPIGALCGWYYETRLRDRSRSVAVRRAVE